MRLGVSAKALRLYEQRGLIAPLRTAAGWRAYGPDEMARAAEIVALRQLGLSLSQIARVLAGDSDGLEPALAAHQAALEDRVHQLVDAVDKVRRLRADLAGGRAPAVRELARLLRPASGFSVAFDLPWPWGGERFELHDIRALNYIIGPLGSGKTRLAKRIAETLPGPRSLAWNGGWTMVKPSRRCWTVTPPSSHGLIRRWSGSSRTVLQFPTRCSVCSLDWKRKGRLFWSSTWWSRGSTRPRSKL